MKFRSDLGYYENLSAWEEHFCSAPHTQYSSMRESEKAWLMEFNDSLRKLEDKFNPIIDAKLQELQAREADPSDWLMEFNLTLFITFYLREDDLEYEEDDDNILMGFQQRFFENAPLDLEWGFGATHVDHAEPSQDFTDECHCYLYRQLYDHCYLDWRDMFRIGSLYVEIKIDEQSGSTDLGFIQYEQKP